MKIIFIYFRYIIALVIRIFLIILSEILLKYDITYADIDYSVFNDGAKHLLKFESPYNRETYRYTPLLAFMVIPNHLININFGKFLFVLIDLANGFLIEILLNLQTSLVQITFAQPFNIYDSNKHPIQQSISNKQKTTRRSTHIQCEQTTRVFVPIFVVCAGAAAVPTKEAKFV